MRVADRQNGSAAEFRHVLYLRRGENDLSGCPPGELVATDGMRVRSIRARDSFVSFREFDDLRLAREIVDLIQREWRPSAAFMGYETFSDAEIVAILNGGPAGEQWAAFPCRRDESSILALCDGDGERNQGAATHVVGGAELRWRHGEPLVETALEIRNDAASVGLENELSEHIEFLELRAIATPVDEPREIGLVPEGARRRQPVGPSPFRAEAEFPLNPVVFRQFRGCPTFQAWFCLQFDESFLRAPPVWRCFAMKVDLPEA